MPKILLILILAGVAVNMCVGGFWRMSFFRHSHAALERNVAQLRRLLASEVGGSHRHRQGPGPGPA